jgi:hypothetical protein
VSVITIADTQPQGHPQIASVLLVVQGSLLLAAGLSALPFGIVEPFIGAESLATVLLAGGIFLLARGVRRHRRWARKGTLVLEVLSVVGSLPLILLPIGAMRGPAPLLSNLVLPAAVWILLRTRSSLRVFSRN